MVSRLAPGHSRRSSPLLSRELSTSHISFSLSIDLPDPLPRLVSNVTQLHFAFLSCTGELCCIRQSQSGNASNAMDEIAKRKIPKRWSFLGAVHTTNMHGIGPCECAAGAAALFSTGYCLTITHLIPTDWLALNCFRYDYGKEPTELHLVQANRHAQGRCCTKANQIRSDCSACHSESCIDHDIHHFLIIW